jgi:magnesium-transporting ATPase (P-type)
MEFLPQIQISINEPDKELGLIGGSILLKDQKSLNIESQNVLLRGSFIEQSTDVKALVIYTGDDTKQALNKSQPRFKRSVMSFYIQVIFVCWLNFIVGLTVLQIYLQTNEFFKFKETALYLYYGSKSKSMIGNFVFTLMINASKLPFVIIVVLELEKAIY